MRYFVALLSGSLFGFGLLLSEMTDPKKVINFLNMFGNWDPSLALVMFSALLVYGIVYWAFLSGKKVSLLGDLINQPSNTSLTPRLIIGAITFGIGWGMTGICPGPAIANISGGNIKMIVFIIVMLIGMKASSWLKNKI